MTMTSASKWKVLRLGQVALIERSTVKPENIISGTAYIGMEHIDNDGEIKEIPSIEAGELASNKFSFDERHVLYGKLRPYLKKIARPNFHGICSTDILPILPKDCLDKDYLYYFLRQPHIIEFAVSRCSGANLPRLSPKELAEFPVPLPPLEEQKRIAAILDKADAIRKKRKQAIELTEQFLRSAFLDMFGDPVTNPKGWPIEKLGDHLNFVTSGSRGWAKYYSQTGARFIRSLDVQMNRLGNEDVAYVRPPESAESARTLVSPGDVLLTITGSRIGRVSAVPDDVGEAYISQHVAILRVNDAIKPRFLSMFLSDSLGGQYQIASMQYGQTKPGLNLEQIHNFSIPLPPIQKQKEFCALWDKVISMSVKLKGSIDLSNNHFNALLQNAFRGEL